MDRRPQASTAHNVVPLLSRIARPLSGRVGFLVPYLRGYPLKLRHNRRMGSPLSKTGALRLTIKATAANTFAPSGPNQSRSIIGLALPLV
jgi:hypothetical protein